MEKEIVKALLDFLKLDKRPAISKILYFACGIIGIFCIVCLIVPFDIDVIFLRDIRWNENLCDKDLLVESCFWIIIGHMFWSVVKKLLVCYFSKENNVKLKEAYANIYTVDDIMDLIMSVVLLLFIVCVLAQIYQTGILYMSIRACFIYIVIAFKFLSFVAYRFRANNLKVIGELLN